MPNNQKALDKVFQTLANSTRRGVVAELTTGPKTVGQLARKFDMAMPSFMQHLEVMEECGVIRSQKTGRVRTIQLKPTPLILAEHWLETRQQEWKTRLNQFDEFATELYEKK